MSQRPVSLIIRLAIWRVFGENQTLYIAYSCSSKLTLYALTDSVRLLSAWTIVCRCVSTVLHKRWSIFCPIDSIAKE